MAKKETKVTLHSLFNVGEVDKRVFGGFIEHMGRCVYEGIYDPDSPNSNEQGIREDVVKALDELQFTALRYPGGNFVSGYHWQDGIGPKEKRPTVQELAWKSIETNQFGTDEFMQLAKKLNWEPMMTVNLGTGTPEEARNWVEYCNAPIGTKYSNMRAENGHPEPYGVKLWCIGNEMDGNWQLGHVPAKDYAIRAQQTAKLIKDTDSEAEIVVCGSCADIMPTYMQWDMEVLEYVGDYADYISLHKYAGDFTENISDYLATSNTVDRHIEQMEAVCKFIQAKRKSDKRVHLCYDEWNVWYREKNWDGKWKQSPHLLEEEYNLQDAIVVSGFLNSFVRHANVVKIANLAQAVNVIAPIMTNKTGMFKQTIFYPFKMYSQRRKGVSLTPIVEGPGFESKSYGYANYIDTSAILDGKTLHVFFANRDLENQMQVELCPSDMSVRSLTSAELLTGDDPEARNCFENPDNVRAIDFEEISIKNGKATLTMPPLSLVAATFGLE